MIEVLLYKNADILENIITTYNLKLDKSKIQEIKNKYKSFMPKEEPVDPDCQLTFTSRDIITSSKGYKIGGSGGQFQIYAEKSGAVPALLNQYYKNKQGRTLKKVFITKYYINYWNKIFNQLKGKSVDIWNKSISTPDDFLKLNDTEIFQNNLKYELQDYSSRDGYKYKENEAFVNFANQFLGGGALGSGFVQEEKIMVESSMLFLVTYAHKYSKSGEWFKRDICPNTDLQNLNKDPAIIKCQMFAEIDHDYVSDINVIVNELNSGNKQKYKPLKNIIDNVYWICVAHESLLGGRNATKSTRIDAYNSNLDSYIERAFKGFYKAVVVLKNKNPTSKEITINTGNWGAGAFGHQWTGSWVVQMLAAEMVAKKFPEITINYKYWPYDDKAKRDIVQAKLWYDNYRGTNIANVKRKLIQEIEKPDAVNW